ncbi:TVP38/TMEM64 family protein [Varunaivibrio sulfuroxidans]|uniref:Putative membrane protein YdjX (TVP38/TMEM64 family) n=1 Tax=Varunaivibrio sulfuroxidans TaxID=1773489 RepID=A0A4R3JGE9_9PROT|nr:TVP38/TMEM64 family protein [Varunaivibrio sulfuroxidans]TCS65004.1 putative membrane protein YdjX (TVP38/TMEM64 family) [Varunaivibrio sulfuroxidans]WES29706.1 TVP38/TMEM64 family protein [Varunaivibrio sulfuroxidans]
MDEGTPKNSLESPANPMRFAPLGVLVLGFVGFFALDLQSYLNFETLTQHRDVLMGWTRANPTLTAALFCAVYILVVVLSVPGALWVTLAGGFLFGAVQGSILILFSATVGATAVFLAARTALADFFEARAGSVLRRMEDGFRENAFNYLLVLRLAPLFPFWLVNLVPALLGVRLSTYVIASALGMIPGIVVYASVGAGLGDLIAAGKTPDMSAIFAPGVLWPLLGLSALSLIPVVYKKFAPKSARSTAQNGKAPHP